MIEIHLLEQLAAFAEHGTLSEAAEKLHTSQPALTRSMKKLEQELGVSLFIRSKNHLALNETGVQAAKYARRVLDADREWEAQVRAFDRSLHTISIGFCAPIPQLVLTPLINDVFEGMTISADMTDDRDFLKKLESSDYQLAVTHYQADNERFYCKKIGHEDLFISVPPGHPLAASSEIHLSDLDGLSLLLLQRIGFWTQVREKTPNSRYLLQIEQDSFAELAENSRYPVFSSSYNIHRNNVIPGRLDIPVADAECHTDFYLVCLASEQKRYAPLFKRVGAKTIV